MSDARARQRREKFVSLATKRVNRAIRELRLIGNLSNKSAYAYTEADAKKIMKALQREMDALKTRFGGTGATGEAEFTLDT